MTACSSSGWRPVPGNFIRNDWYVAALSAEVGDRPIGFTVLGEPIVLFRDSAGAVVALEDRCVHRQAPLSLGSVVGDRLQCGYHGFTYDRTGSCVLVPSQDRVPPGAAVRAYPVRERQGMIFVWTGDPALSAQRAPYDFPYAEGAGWSLHFERLYGRFDYRLLIDNLLDLTHLSFAHKTTIGSAGLARDDDTRTERDGDKVRVSRWMPDIEQAPAHVEITGHPGRIDRWQVIEFTPPCYIWLQVGTAKAGRGGRGAAPEDTLLDRHALHVMTPETEASTHYLWVMANKAGTLSADQERILHDRSIQAFNEDIAILEGQQSRLDPERVTVDVGADAGQIAGRRLLEKLIAEDAGRSGLAGTG